MLRRIEGWSDTTFKFFGRVWATMRSLFVSCFSVWTQKYAQTKNRSMLCNASRFHLSLVSVTFYLPFSVEQGQVFVLKKSRHHSKEKVSETHGGARNTPHGHFTCRFKDCRHFVSYVWCRRLFLLFFNEPPSSGYFFSSTPMHWTFMRP